MDLALVITKVKILTLSRHSLILTRLYILVTRPASGQQFMGKLSRKSLDFNYRKSCYVLESCVSRIFIRILELLKVWMRSERAEQRVKNRVSICQAQCQS